MRMKKSKRILSITVAAALCASLLPAAALAATNVTPTPSQSSASTLNVEYFSSTMYNWDEDKANAATATADQTSGTTYTTASNVRVNSFNNANSITASSYYYSVNGTYYLVYYTKTQGSGLTLTLYYYDASGTLATIGTYSGSSTLPTLYTASSGGYEGKGFYFTNANNKQSSPVFSNWLGSAQNYMIYSGLAESNLAESTNVPFDNDTVNAANLFATDGSNTSYADVYTNVGVPFVYDESTGYYTLDSDQYAVYFDGGADSANSSTNLTIADKPAMHSYTEVSGYSYATGFLPFNDVSSSTQTGLIGGSTSSTTSGYTISGDTVWGFGMAMTVNFTMTEDGTITVTDSEGNETTEDIIFEFSGDDDVWVYVDNTLALDIGGTHDAITGTINFRSGAVTLTAGTYGKIADRAGYTSLTNIATSTSLSQTNLYTALNTNLTTFAGSGTHTLTVYYMERGRGRSNCKIKFNLPQTDTVNVTKELNSTDSIGQTLSEDELNTDFTFTLYKNGSVVTDTDYIIQNANGSVAGSGNTGSDGTFILKGGQTAVFDLSLDGYRTYYVTEVNPSTGETYYENPSWTYSSNISDTTYVTTSSSAWTSATAQLTGSKDTAESLTFVCTNTKSYAPSVDVNAVDDVVVIDYNLPVTVDVLDNDEVIGNDPTVSVESQGSYGNSEANDDNTITYTLKNVLSEVDSVVYTLTATGTVDDTITDSDTATLSVVPANSVYYEDDFATNTTDGVVGITYGDRFWSTEESNSNAEQSSDNVIYGTDAAYADMSDNNSYYSNDSLHTGQSGATATFTFTGTGVDIYSSTDNDACIVYVYLYEGDSTSGTMTQYAVANNYAANGTYFVVPTVTFEGLTYGTYTIKLRVVKNSTVSGAVNYYLDGIRVYNPLGTVTNDGSIADNAYAAANELNAVFTEIRSMLLDGTANVDGKGMLFIDDINAADEADGENTNLIGTYESVGPEHEVYLSEGNGVAFTLENFEEGDAVYVGIKSAQGDSSTVQVTNGDEGNAKLSITSTADQYYKITPDSEGNVVIVNTGDGNDENDAIISLTKVRTTSPETKDITFVSNETTVEAVSSFSLLSVSSYSDEILTEEEAEEAEEAVEEAEETEDTSGDVVIEIEEEDAPAGSESQSSFSSIFNKIIGWISGRR